MHEYENFKTMSQGIQTSVGKITPSAILNQLVAEKTLTPAGLAWLKLATDPWHDTSVTGFTGMPDQGIGKSVTFQVVREYQISKANAPTPLPPGNWSCRIGNFPILENVNMSPGAFFGEIVTQDNAPASTRLMVPVQVNYAAEGVDFGDTAVIALGNAQGCSLPDEFTKGLVKVCGVGMEVINTTAVLNKQGLMSCARMTQPEVEPYVSYVALTTPVNAWTIKGLSPIRTLPKNLTEMALYPGYAQEEAKDGYYAPVALKFGKNRNYPVPLTPILLDDDVSAGPQNPLTPIACYSAQVGAVTVPGNASQFFTTNIQPLFYGCDSNVVMFTGLSESTTLTLRVRYILERFPSDAEGQILVIATPSADYDPCALEIYSRVVQRLPSGTPFTDNPSGEWWQRMLSEIGKVAAPMIKMIPHPLAQGLGAAIDMALPALNNNVANQKAAKDLRKANKEIKAAKQLVQASRAPQIRRQPNNGGNIPRNPGPNRNFGGVPASTRKGKGTLKKAQKNQYVFG
jgi:hypothetical protein